MDKCDWPKEAIIQLIGLWQKHECLFNPKHTFYHNKHARYTALNEMAAELKAFNSAIGPNEVKNKITYLRGQYTREVAKTREKKSGLGTDDVYVPSAWWFRDLSFLDEFVKIKKGGGCNFNDSNCSQIDESSDSLPPLESDSPQPKRMRIASDTSSFKNSPEDLVLAAAANALQNLAQKPTTNENDETFCNFIRTELGKIKNANIKEDLIETLTLSIFEAKKKAKLCGSSATD